jgi:hypothetical protein
MKRKRRPVSFPSNTWTVKNFAITALLVVSIIVNFPLLLSSSIAVAQSSARIPVYEITTRDVEFSFQGVKEGNGSGYGNYELGDIQNLYDSCPNEIAIFVHGWHVDETEARERLDRVKMSLENQNYSIIPLVGLSWHSDTEWLAAQFIAKWNGPLLADFIANLTDNCTQNQQPGREDLKIRLIGHSLGARVILSALDSLHKNATTTWNEGNFKIASVHLLGAAVDNEEVSMSPRDISDDKTNWGSPKSDYGEAIQEEVVDFYNLYSPEDNALEPYPAPYFGIYPSFEGDQALGQSGNQTKLTVITLPENYNEMSVESQLPENSSIENSDINMTDSDGDGDCDFDFYDPIHEICLNAAIGDSHGGYIGFRDPNNNSSLADDGAIDVVVDNWKAVP